MSPGKTEVSAVQYEWQSSTDFKTYSVSRTHEPANPQSHSSLPLSLFAPYGLPRRPRRPRRSFSPPVEDPAIQRRREVYRRNLYSQHVGSNQFSGYCDVSPQDIAQSSDLQRKARTWIRRELRVFAFLHGGPPRGSSHAPTSNSNMEFLLSYIVSILKMVDLKASNGHAENLLTEFLGRHHSRLFLHELNAWLRSPYTKVEDWDNEVQYAEGLSSTEG